MCSMLSDFLFFLIQFLQIYCPYFSSLIQFPRSSPPNWFIDSACRLVPELLRETRNFFGGFFLKVCCLIYRCCFIFHHASSSSRLAHDDDDDFEQLVHINGRPFVFDLLSGDASLFYTSAFASSRS